jgi:hypothetical protein
MKLSGKKNKRRLRVQKTIRNSNRSHKRKSLNYFTQRRSTKLKNKISILNKLKKNCNPKTKNLITKAGSMERLTLRDR